MNVYKNSDARNFNSMFAGKHFNLSNMSKVFSMLVQTLRYLAQSTVYVRRKTDSSHRNTSLRIAERCRFQSSWFHLLLEMFWSSWYIIISNDRLFVECVFIQSPLSYRNLMEFLSIRLSTVYCAVPHGGTSLMVFNCD